MWKISSCIPSENEPSEVKTRWISYQVRLRDKATDETLPIEGQCRNSTARKCRRYVPDRENDDSWRSKEKDQRLGAKTN